MIYFTLGYIIVWLLLLGYTALVNRQQSALEEQLVVLEEMVEKQAG